jgi:serine/threonine-protein kinase
LPENALTDFTSSIQKDPSNPEGYWGRVNAYLDLDKYDFAIRDISTAINLNPDNAIYYYTRAIIYTELNDTANFYNDVEKIVNNYPGDFFSNYKSQTVILILDNIAHNIKFLSQLIEIAPDNYLLYFRRGFNYYVFKKFNLAIEDFSNVVKYSGDTNSRLFTLTSKLVDNCKTYSDR